MTKESHTSRTDLDDPKCLRDSKNMTYLDTNSPSELILKLSDNISKIESGISIEFLTFITAVFSIAASVIISFVINWKLSLILSCLLPMIVGASVIFSRAISNETTNELTKYARAGKIVQEVFSSLRTVHALNGSQFEQKRYDKELDSTHWSSIRKGVVFGVYMGWMAFLVYLVYAVGFVFGAILMSSADRHVASINHILVIVMLYAQFVQLFGLIGPLFQSFSEGRGAAEPVFRLIEEEQNICVNEYDVLNEDKFKGESVTDLIGDIQFHHVSLVYPSRKDATALNDLNVIFRANKTTALVGSSGSGKYFTCISLLLRFYEPSSGQITIDDRPLTDYDIKKLRQSIGVVSQEPILFSMSIYENIRFGQLNATRQEIEAAAKEANAHNFIMKLPDGYETLTGEHGVQLSGGEKQRIALARALVKQPSILLLDEATSALDNVSEKIVQEALDRASKNRTTIVIAHRLSTIKNADHIYVLDNGRFIEEGTHETLIAKEDGKYGTMIKAQQMTRMIDEDRNDLMSTITTTAEDQKQISQRTHALREGELLTTDQKDTTSVEQNNIFRRLLAMNKSEWVTILVGCLACVFNGLTQPLFAILLTKIINAFKDCGYGNIHYQFMAFTIAGSRLVRRIHSKAFACLLRQEIAYFDRPENSSGAICARLTANATALQDMIGNRLGAICEALALSGFGVLFGFIFSWQLALMSVVLLIILLVVSSISIYLSTIIKEKCDRYRSQANSLAMEVIHNMRTIKQLSVENEVLQQYTDSIQQVLKTSLKFNVLMALSTGIVWSISPLIMALFYWSAIILIENHKLASNEMIMVFAFVIFTLQSFIIIGTLSDRIGQSISAAQIFFDIFDRTPSIDNTSTQGQELSDFRGDIDFDQVKFVYPTRPASAILNKFQLNINFGQRIALVGTSGCGKSTVIQLLERFYDITQGQLFLDGVDIRQLNVQWLRSRLGLVSQEPVLFDMTIAENIIYGLENIPIEEIINAASKANIHEFIQQLPQGYETRVGVKGSFMSGGEKQRIAIARVLLRRPKILLLDEATSAMDSFNEQIVQEALDQAQKEDPSRTSIIIAHRLSTIRSCDAIYVLDQGQIVEIGNHTELVQQRGIYYKMLLAQNNLQNYDTM
ncbi:hypothetical protein I4U23_021849 [Adineta vaga]|nr:hypothetical protein I4U23_021849 [Adineta vaga]